MLKPFSAKFKTALLPKLLLLLLLCILSCGLPCQATEINNPKADPQAIVVCGNARFTMLTPQLIRIQYSSKALFEDRATFGVVNRRLPVPEFTQTTHDGWLTITTSALTLRYKIGAELSDAQPDSTALSITIRLGDKTVTWQPGMADSLNLKGTTRTLDGQQGDNKRRELEDGLLSRSGWTLINESPRHKRGDGSTTFAMDGNVDGITWWAEPVDKDAVDWYFMGYGHAYKQALGDYVKIGGRIPMPPLFVFGYWYSKYQRYSQQDFIDLANDIRANHIPLDVMIFDMDWHLEGWTGWTWNLKLIPEPERLISFMHDRQLRVALNLHPADGVGRHEQYFSDMVHDMHLPDTTQRIPWQLENGSFYKALFGDILRKREAQGVDFWWIDWQQNLTSKWVEGLGETFWCNHVFYNDMRLNRTDRRPVIFHRWGGLGCHRYPIGFSGDSYSTFPTLAFQPYFTATASNVCFGYWGHDLGGHMQQGDNDPELYLRWMQFGVFTPIFRTHATNWPGIERRIWKYPNFKSLRQTVELRYQLIPYIYTAAREAYDTGVSICRPLYYEWPERQEAYDREDEYYFGPDMLVAPIVTRAHQDGHVEKSVWLPEGRWFDVCQGRLLDGNQTLRQSYGLDDIPVFVKAGAIIPTYSNLTNLKTRPDSLTLKVVPGADGHLDFYEDANDDNTYQDGQFTTTPIDLRQSHRDLMLTIHPRQGRFEGMPMQRHYIVEFCAQAKPRQVRLNGKALSFRYDAECHTVSVSLPAATFYRTYQIELRKR